MIKTVEVISMDILAIDDKAKDFILARNADAITVKLERFGGG